MDFYQLLKVSRTASLSEIKQSYRKIALNLHVFFLVEFGELSFLVGVSRMLMEDLR